MSGSAPPYDNKEYRYRHTDPDRGSGIARLAELLGLPPDFQASGAHYDLSFFSGGIGVFDQLAATLPADDRLWKAVLDACPAKTPEDIAADPTCSPQFLWLVCGKDSSLEVRTAAVAFINAERRDFQTECRAFDTVLFLPDSDVNDWFALWGTATEMNVRAFSQG
jgi:hypothetical protein